MFHRRLLHHRGLLPARTKARPWKKSKPILQQSNRLNSLEEYILLAPSISIGDHETIPSFALARSCCCPLPARSSGRALLPDQQSRLHPFVPRPSSQIDLLVPPGISWTKMAWSPALPIQTVLKRPTTTRLPSCPSWPCLTRRLPHAGHQSRRSGHHERSHDPRVQTSRLHRLSV